LMLMLLPVGLNMYVASTASFTRLPQSLVERSTGIGCFFFRKNVLPA